jgi:hypothetical protein
MKQILMIMSLATVIASCGANNKVNSGAAPHIDELQPGPLTSFEGDFYLIENRENTFDCGFNLEVRRQCDGYILVSNNRMGPEEFCNINQGGRVNSRNNPGRGSSDLITVTQAGNVIKSEVNVGPNRVYTTTLSLDANGILTKVSRLKGRDSNCVYRKR